MGKFIAWLGSTILAVTALVVGILPVLDSWPRWVVLAVGALILLGVVFTFSGVVDSMGNSRGDTNIDQNAKAGDDATIKQYGIIRKARDIG
jgi:hypothetical protein